MTFGTMNDEAPALRPEHETKVDSICLKWTKKIKSAEKTQFCTFFMQIFAYMQKKHYFCRLKNNSMKKSTKISLLVLAVLAGVIALCVTFADVWASRYAEKMARQQLDEAQLPVQIDFKHIHVFLMTGCVDVEGIVVESGNLNVESQKIVDTLHVEIPHLVVSNFRYSQLRKKILAVRRVDVLKMSGAAKGLSVDSLSVTARDVKYSLRDSLLTVSAVAADLMNARIEIPKKMHFELDSLSAAVHNLSYSVKDSVFTYNDSVYSLFARRFQVKLYESLMAIETKNVSTQDGGEITMGKTRIWNTVGKRRLGEIRKEPTTWIDLRLKAVTLPPMNLFRTDFTKGLYLPHVTVEGDKLETLRDVRFKPKHPYGMPQQALLKMKYPLRIGAVEAKLNTVDVNVLCTDRALGTLLIKDLNATVCDFSNKRGSKTNMQMKAKLGTGNVTGEINLYMDSKSRFDAFFKGKELDTQVLHPLVRPLAGIELNCMIDSLKLKYSGDDYAIAGKILLAYHGLSGKVYRDENVPFQIISKNAGAIDYFVNHLIPKSNPRAGLKEPLAYRVEYIRKDTQPFPMYMCMPIILGSVETFLPGFNVSKKVKKDEL